MTRTITYLGKEGQPGDQRAAVNGLSGSYGIGESKTFDAEAAGGLGFESVAAMDEAIDAMVAAMNTGRPEDQPLFTVSKKAPSAPPTAPAGNGNGKKAADSTVKTTDSDKPAG